MKKIRICVLAIMVGVSGMFSCSKSSDPSPSGPIKITAADIKRAAGSSLTYVDVAASALIATPISGENVTWDYTSWENFASLPYSIQYGTPPRGTSFTGATYTRPRNLSILGAGFVPAVRMLKLDNAEWSDLGLVVPETTIDLPGQTDGSTITIMGGDVKFIPSGRVFLKFPLEMGKKITTEFTETYNYKVSSSSRGLKNTPAQEIGESEKTVECIGYGTLKLPGHAPMRALLVKDEETILINYTVGGAPAPKALLDEFGLAENTVRIDVRYTFYVNGLGDVAYIYTNTFSPNTASYMIKE
jgi:hypothetical protein